MRVLARRILRTVVLFVLAMLCACVGAPRERLVALSQDAAADRKANAPTTSKDLMAAIKGLWENWDEAGAAGRLRSLAWPPYDSACQPSKIKSAQVHADAAVTTTTRLRFVQLRPEHGIAGDYEFRRGLPVSSLVELGDYHVLLGQKPEAVERDVEDLEEWALIAESGKQTLSLLWAVKWRGKWWWLPPGQYASGNEDRRLKAQATSKGLAAYVIELVASRPADMDQEAAAVTWPLLRAFVSQAFSSEGDPQSKFAEPTMHAEFRREISAREFCETDVYGTLTNESEGDIARQIEQVEEWAVLAGEPGQEEDIGVISMIKWRGKWWCL